MRILSLDIDECDPDDPKHDCWDISFCENTVGSFNCSYECKPKCKDNAVCVLENSEAVCRCIEGYEGVGTVGCTDIDECRNFTICNQDTDDNQFCINVEGSFNCDCDIGYQMLANGTCGDINECEFQFTHNCLENDTCINTVGSYTCDRIGRKKWMRKL